MSELMNAGSNRCHFRWQLLATVSALALAGCVWCDHSAFAADQEDRPTIWIELGGQLERAAGGEESFAPPFASHNFDAPYNAVSPLSAERRPHYAFGGEGAITFEPEGTEWKFSLNIRYGRTSRANHLHQQTSSHFRLYFLSIGSTFVSQLGLPKQYASVTRFSDGQAKRDESHSIVDFMAGKDVGLGLFGREGSSVISAGVRYAQFGSRLSTTFHSVPTFYRYPVYIHRRTYNHHQSYYANAELARSFHGIGPSVSWVGSAPFLGRPDAGEIAVDWGVNAAVLFGRHKVRGSHMTTGRYFSGTGSNNASPVPTNRYVRTAPPINRSRSAIVPNLGGFAGLSFNFPNAKVSFGYRADFFFGAMDGGIDTAKSYARDFYGPYATVSIGLGG